MRIAQLSLQQFPKILTSGLATIATIAAINAEINVAMFSNAQAQVPAGLYEVQANGQIFFRPADSTRNSVVVYNGRQRALAIVQYGGALYTAFDGVGFVPSFRGAPTNATVVPPGIDGPTNSSYPAGISTVKLRPPHSRVIGWNTTPCARDVASSAHATSDKLDRNLVQPNIMLLSA